MCSDILPLNSRELVSQAAFALRGPKTTQACLLTGTDSSMKRKREVKGEDTSEADGKEKKSVFNWNLK